MQYKWYDWISQKKCFKNCTKLFKKGKTKKWNNKKVTINKWRKVKLSSAAKEGAHETF